jgi:hypothetical protein
MKRYNFFIIIVGLILIFSSCERDKILFDESMTFVSFDKATVNIPEEGGPVKIAVKLSGLSGTEGTSVSYEVSTEGFENPASGSDYSIAESEITFPGEGIAYLTVTPVDNDVFTGDKSFKIKLTSVSKGYLIGAEKEVTIVIKDNEHPLAAWIGTYDVAAASYGDPGNWDEAWVVTTEPDPSDVNRLVMTGIGAPSGEAIYAVINMDEMTVTIKAGQTLAGDVYGYGDMAIVYGTPDFDFDSGADIVGTITADGNMQIDNWGHLMTGDYAIYGLWDVFNTTWTKQ